MTRYFVWFLFFTILLNVIDNSKADDEKKDEDDKVETKSTAKDAPKDDKSAKESKDEDDKKENDDDKKDDPADGSDSRKSLFDRFGSGKQPAGSFLAPAKKVTSRITEAVTKGMDGAKDMADGAYNFIKGAVTSVF